MGTWDAAAVPSTTQRADRGRAPITSPEPLVLVVDDEESVRQALERALRYEGFAVATAAGGVEALESVARRPPAVIVLDVTMPDLDGVSVVKRLRADGQDMPVCILSARDDVSDRVAGLQAGADDYLVKPFALAELTARLQALLRRRGADVGAPLMVGDLVVDARRHVATRAGRDLGLTRREFELLEAFARHAGQVLSREQLLGQVWGYTFDVETNVVDVFVGYLRRKLEAGGEPRMLQTVRGVGWALRS
jgi:DNA-binding response OmpR family regulator